MKTLEERMAEIDRRCMIIFQKRKQQKKRILIACVPAVLCATLFFTIILPAITPSVSENHSISPEQMEGNSNYPVTKIEISGYNLSLSHTETTDIIMISNFLNACTDVALDKNSVSDDANGDDFSGSSTTASTNQQATNSSTTTTYTIMLLQQDSVIREYSLAGSSLRDLSTNETYTLTQEQAKELKRLLAIPLYE